MFILKVMNALKKRKVGFAVTGGYAVALHGAVRGTVDIDIVISLTNEAFRGAEAALKSIGLQSRQPLEAVEVFEFREEYIEKRNLKAWTFVNPKDPTELVDILLTDDLKALKTKSIKIQGQAVPIVDIDDLIKMKEKSGRKQDREDVKALRKLK